MQPKDDSNAFDSSQTNTPPQTPPNSGVGGTDESISAAEAAAQQLIRDQIDKIYDGDQPKAAPAPSANENQEIPPAYGRSHSNEAAALQNAGHSDAWKNYHSAWQSYYQQYYQRYYLQQLHAQGQRLQQNPSSGNSVPKREDFFNAPEPKVVHSEVAETSKEIKDQLVAKVQERAKKVRKSHHFVPIVSALVVGLLFIFLQYNRVFVAQVKAYVSPGSVNPQNIIVDPSSDTTVGQEPRLIIPKINVDAPVVYGVQSLADAPIQDALREGVVHYPIPGAHSTPGQKGNAVFLGHSSNDVFDNGKYKFVFVLLERMQPGDTFYIHYQGVRYTYSVTKKEVINPNEVSKLIVQTDKPLATLVTCVPPGTALKRLVVWAEQISPDPNKANAATESEADNQPTVLPDDGQSILERLFGF